ncbi:hypothetical protein ABEB36_005564 [Hypothenemus hampei]|uniref:Spaetzle domain-containing protein n=1 Tax=Hypothenemus hampei TaxID=57062 RepID=A0ABD1EYM9_HYPHA
MIMKNLNICLVSILICYALAVPVKESRKIRKFIPKIRKTSCTGLEICNDSNSYPTKRIQKLVKRKKNLPFFSTLNLIEPADDVPVPSLRDSPEMKNLCRTRTLTMVPKTGFDHQSQEHRYIVNVKDHVQTVVYETCVNPKEQECKIDLKNPYEYHTGCVQKYNMVRLVSLTKTGNLEYGKFMVPSTCVCSYFKDINNAIPVL